MGQRVRMSINISYGGDFMSYQEKSIKSALSYIETGRMFLPEIQRKFVWKEHQIQNLFDSIILGYPIGTFLFWKTSKRIIHEKQLILYKFTKDFHERDKHDNEKASSPLITDYENYYIVLDGQQRLSSLFIALQGSIAMKLPRCWWNVDASFPKKELYFDLSSDLEKKVEDDEIIHRFKFFKPNEVPGPHWFMVKQILKYENISGITRYAIANNLDDRAITNLSTLYEKINDSKGNSAISYYEINEVDYDDVLNIFVRVNSSGTYLSKTDLLFSTIVSSWPGAREKIEDLLKSMNEKGDKFNFGTDFVMRTCLALTDSPINLKIDSFKRSNILEVRDKWNKIEQSLMLLSRFLVNYGFSDGYITSYNALIPIVYYLYNNGTYTDENIEEFRKYFIVSQIKNLFGVASNSAITDTRRVLQNIECKKTKFSLTLFKDIKLFGDRDFLITPDYLDNVFEYEIGAYTFMILSLLYPKLKFNQVKWHQDHIHPHVGFEYRKIKNLGLDRNTINRWQKDRNKLANLQLLERSSNEAKNDKPLCEWLLDGNTVDYYPEDVPCDLLHFDEFMNKRKDLMKKTLVNILCLEND
jgi:uncharacterized protein with ParB-like and HNH nuclease domain